MFRWSGVSGISGIEEMYTFTDIRQIISFGKYRGLTIEQIAEQHPDYIQWLLESQYWKFDPILTKTLLSAISLSSSYKRHVFLDNTKHLNSSMSEEGDYTRREIMPDSLLVVESKLYCVNNHVIEHIIAVLQVVDQIGEYQTIEMPAAYCTTCKIYYVHNEIFKQAKNNGILLAQVVSEDVYKRSRGGGDFLSMNIDSPLSRAGYSVSSADGLSEIQRQSILAELMNYQLLSRDRIIEYLQYFIRLSENRQGMYDAVRKWKNDILFVASYHMHPTRKVKFDKVSIRI